MMNISKNISLKKTGILAITGGIIMLAGGVLWGASGTDLWAALATNDMAAYLSSLPDAKTLLCASTGCWTVGALMMTMAGTMMSELSSRNGNLSIAAKVSIGTGCSIAIVSFAMMLAIALHIAPDTSESSITLATALGAIGTNLDDLATILIIGFFPVLISAACFKTWFPKWLFIWAGLAGITSLISLVGIFVPLAPGLTFLLIPFGIGWMIASGVVLIRQGKKAAA